MGKILGSTRSGLICGLGGGLRARLTGRNSYAGTKGKKTMSKNYNCDGAHCTDPKGEVRTYKLGAGGNLILCRACWQHENAWRCEQAKIYDPENWPQIDWNRAEVYTS